MLKKRKDFKIEKGGPFGFSENPVFLQNIKKFEGRTLWRQKNRKKVAQCQKNQRGDSIVSSGFVSYVKNEINERGPFALF